MNKFTDIAPAPTASSGADQRQYLALRDRFALQIERGGLPPGAKFPSERTLQFETGLARGTIRDAPSSLVYVLRRRRSIDGRPVLVERILVHPDVAPGLSDHNLDSSLTALLQSRYGVTMARTRVEMQPCALVREEASLLGAKSGSPGLLVLRTCFDAKGRVVEYDEEHWRHDTVRILVDTRPTPPEA